MLLYVRSGDALTAEFPLHPVVKHFPHRFFVLHCVVGRVYFPSAVTVAARKTKRYPGRCYYTVRNNNTALYHDQSFALRTTTEPRAVHAPLQPRTQPVVGSNRFAVGVRPTRRSDLKVGPVLHQNFINNNVARGPRLFSVLYKP